MTWRKQRFLVLWSLCCHHIHGLSVNLVDMASCTIFFYFASYRWKHLTCVYVKYCKIYFTLTCTQNDERFPPASPLVLAEAGLGVVPSPKLEEDFKLRSLNWSILCFHFLCVTVCQCNSLRYNSIQLICVSHPFVACIRVHVYIM